MDTLVAMGNDSTGAGRTRVEHHIARLTEILAIALSGRGTERLSLTGTGPLGAGLAGRVSAHRITADAPLPGFDNSQMDGFAVRSADLPAAAVRRNGHDEEFVLPVASVAAAGSAPQRLPAGAALAIMTGAPIPEGADLVIPVEKSREGFGSESVTFTELSEADTRPGRFIRRAGSDVSTHDVILEQHQLLTPARLGLLAACGIDEVEVLQRPRTVVISTGEEIRAPGQPLGPGELYDANGALLSASVEGFGHEVSSAHLATDSPEVFAEAFDALLAAHSPQLVITAGGISAGAYEVVRQVLSARGITFGTVAQQPGGPQGWGILDPEMPVRRAEDPPVAVVALPGNPVSTAVSLETLVRPALAAVDPACPAPRRLSVRLGQDLESPRGLRQFRRVELMTNNDGPLTAVPVGGPSSHLLGHLARADALLELAETDELISAGSVREAIVLPGWGPQQGWSGASGRGAADTEAGDSETGEA
ncbi:molybdopterin molybdotransferase MoeA [Nesterenkonia flava]